MSLGTRLTDLATKISNLTDFFTTYRTTLQSTLENKGIRFPKNPNQSITSTTLSDIYNAIYCSDMLLSPYESTRFRKLKSIDMMEKFSGKTFGSIAASGSAIATYNRSDLCVMYSLDDGDTWAKCEDPTINAHMLRLRFIRDWNGNANFWGFDDTDYVYTRNFIDYTTGSFGEYGSLKDLKFIDGYYLYIHTNGIIRVSKKREISPSYIYNPPTGEIYGDATIWNDKIYILGTTNLKIYYTTIGQTSMTIFNPPVSDIPAFVPDSTGAICAYNQRLFVKSVSTAVFEIDNTGTVIGGTHINHNVDLTDAYDENNFKGIQASNDISEFKPTKFGIFLMGDSSTFMQISLDGRNIRKMPYPGKARRDPSNRNFMPSVAICEESRKMYFLNFIAGSSKEILSIYEIFPVPNLNYDIAYGAVLNDGYSNLLDAGFASSSYPGVTWNKYSIPTLDVAIVSVQAIEFISATKMLLYVTRAGDTALYDYDLKTSTSTLIRAFTSTDVCKKLIWYASEYQDSDNTPYGMLTLLNSTTLSYWKIAKSGDNYSITQINTGYSSMGFLGKLMSNGKTYFLSTNTQNTNNYGTLMSCISTLDTASTEFPDIQESNIWNITVGRFANRICYMGSGTTNTVLDWYNVDRYKPEPRTITVPFLNTPTIRRNATGSGIGISICKESDNIMRIYITSDGEEYIETSNIGDWVAANNLDDTIYLGYSRAIRGFVFYSKAMSSIYTSHPLLLTPSYPKIAIESMTFTWSMPIIYFDFHPTRVFLIARGLATNAKRFFVAGVSENPIFEINGAKTNKFTAYNNSSTSGTVITSGEHLIQQNSVTFSLPSGYYGADITYDIYAFS